MQKKKSGMKEKVSDEKLIIISVADRGINDSSVKCFAQLPSTPLTPQEHRPVRPKR